MFKHWTVYREQEMLELYETCLDMEYAEDCRIMSYRLIEAIINQIIKEVNAEYKKP